MAKRLDFVFDMPDTPPRSALERQRRNAQTKARKARMNARRNALQNAIEGLFVARGWSIREAAQMAGWWVADRLATAKSVMERYGFCYDTMAWRNA